MKEWLAQDIKCNPRCSQDYNEGFRSGYDLARSVVEAFISMHEREQNAKAKRKQRANTTTKSLVHS